MSNLVSLVPKSLCELWLTISKATLNLSFKFISTNKSSNNRWVLNFDNCKSEFDIVVFAGGHKLFNNISQLDKLPTFTSQGQLTVIDRCFDVDNTIIDNGYIIPNYQGNLQVIGATFRNSDDSRGAIRSEDDVSNISNVSAMNTNHLPII
jgi:tRNA 5-methylaminomethyl-2-thiouridine biosynthesis bifunctional protein